MNDKTDIKNLKPTPETIKILSDFMDKLERKVHVVYPGDYLSGYYQSLRDARNALQENRETNPIDVINGLLDEFKKRSAEEKPKC